MAARSGWRCRSAWDGAEAELVAVAMTLRSPASGGLVARPRPRARASRDRPTTPSRFDSTLMTSDVAPAALDVAHVGRMETGSLGQALLGQATRESKGADRRAQRPQQLVRSRASHRPTLARHRRVNRDGRRPPPLCTERRAASRGSRCRLPDGSPTSGRRRRPSWASWRPDPSAPSTAEQDGSDSSGLRQESPAPTADAARGRPTPSRGSALG